MHMPQAPPPPPPHHPLDQYLPGQFEAMSLGSDIPHFNHNRASHSPEFDGDHDIRPQEFNTSLPHDGKLKEPVSYEGYTFTKLRPELPGQAETWARVKKTPMVMAQKALYEETKKQKNKGPSDKDMIGFKRRQIDHLIEQRTRTDEDMRFEYKLASLKLKQSVNVKGQRETTSMQVILKRQLRPGVVRAATMESRAGGPSEIVDLTKSQFDDRSSQDSYPISGNNFPGYHEPHGMPSQQHFDPHMHGGQFHDMPMPSMPQHDHRQPGMHQGPFMEQHGFEHGFPPEYHHPAQHPSPAHHSPSPDPRTQAKADKPKKAEKKGSKDKKSKDSKKGHKKSHEKHYEEFSDESDSSSSRDSDVSYRTPDSVISSNSSRDYFKEKKYRSGRKEKLRNSRDHGRDHSPRRQIYREHRRKSPVRSPPRAERSRYEYDDYDIISSSHRPPPARRATDYLKRRPSLDHHRALSYDDDLRYETRRSPPLGRRPTPIYTQRRLKPALAIDLYHDDRERDDYEREVRREAAAKEFLREREVETLVRERARREDDLYKRDRMVRDPLDRPAFGDRLGRHLRDHDYF